MARPNGQIPLFCSICNKTPSFSDISHLLTHISSKSHLAQRFKLQISSQTELEARQKLQVYDDWYRSNGLQNLLADRMAAKELKRSKKSSTGAKPIKAEPIAVETPPLQSRIHPDLRAELGPKSQLSFNSEPHRQHGASGRIDTGPRMHLWSTNPRHSTPTQDDTSPLYQTPTMKQRIPGFGASFTPDQEYEKLEQKYIDPTSRKVLDNNRPMSFRNVSNDEPERDISKLKGIYWPGMDLFDSATAEMKRKRNQKKDGSVLQQMKLNSLDVEPTEWVFESDGQLRKTKHIFRDSSSETSPVKSETPSPKRRRSKRVTLQDMSPNTPRFQNLNSPRKTRHLREFLTSRLHREAAASGISPLATSTCSIGTHADVEQEFQFTIADLSRSNHYEVFRKTENESPARTESPLEEVKLEYENGLPVANSDNISAIMDNSPTFVSRAASLRSQNSSGGFYSRERLFLRPLTQPYLEHPTNPLFGQIHRQPYSYPDVRPDVFKTEPSTLGGGF